RSTPCPSSTRAFCCSGEMCMCTRPTPSYRSVSASAGALGLSVLNSFHALSFLLLAVVTAPSRHFPGPLQPGRSAALTGVVFQFPLGERPCVAELESIVWKTLRRPQQTWAPLPLPLHRVVIGAGFPAAGRADIYDDFVELAYKSATGDS